MRCVVLEAGTLPASVFFIGDIHVGNASTNLDAVGQAVKIIANEPKNVSVVLVGLGDYVDAITIDDKRFNPTEPLQYPLHDLPRQQMKHFSEIIKPAIYRSNHSIFLAGNHEEKFSLKKNIDLMDYLINDLFREMQGRVQYGGYEALIRLKLLGKGTSVFDYDIYCSHGSGGGGAREGSPINTVYDMSRYCDADCYVIGHLHRLRAETSAHYALNNRNALVHRFKHYGVGGSFLNRYTENTRNYMEGKRGEPAVFGFLKLSLYTDGNNRLVSRLDKIII